MYAQCSVVSKSLPIDPMDYSPSGSSVRVISQARILEWGAIPSPGNLSDPGIKLSPAMAGGFFTIAPLESPEFYVCQLKVTTHVVHHSAKLCFFLSNGKKVIVKWK